jgi:hypothetical protein
MLAHRQSLPAPHLRRVLLGVPGLLGGAVAAVAILEVPVAFALLCLSRRLQHSVPAVLLCIQLLRALVGSGSLADLVCAALCVALLGDGSIVRAMAALRRVLQPSSGAWRRDSALTAATGADAGGQLKRSNSLDSLASFVSGTAWKLECILCMDIHRHMQLSMRIHRHAYR